MEKSTAFDENVEKLHFLDYWQVISKRKEVIIATFLIIVFIATVLNLILPPTYTGKATIKVESSQSTFDPIIRVEDPRKSVIDPMDFETHIQLMMSPLVLEKVIRGDVQKTFYYCPRHNNINLDSPTANGQCPIANCEQRLQKKIKRKYPEWEDLSKKWAKRNKLDRSYTLQETQNMLLSGLRIEPQRGTKLIDISFTSKDKTESSEVVNMLCEVYLQYTDEANKEKLNAALKGLKEETWDLLHGKHRQTADGRTEVIEKGLIQLENELAALKRKYELIIDTRTGTLVELYDFSPLIQEENRLKSQIAYETIKLNNLESLPSNTRDEKERRWAAFSSHTSILHLKQALLIQKADLAKAKQSYTLKHPIIKQITQLISDLEGNIEDEISGIIFNQSQVVESLKEQVEKIRDIINDSEKDYYDKEVKFYEYKRLLEEVNRKNQLYSQIAQRQTLETIKEAIPSVTLSISQPALVPIYPSGPKRLINIIVGILVGFTVGVGLAYFIEYLDTSIKTIDDIERTLGLQILGVIPQKVRILTEENQNSPAYEAYRILWTNIDFARQENRIQSLLVTSGGVGEGKTTTIVNLAIAVANAGLNVLIVDSDFRRPRIHRLLETSNQTGLTDILMRNADPDGVIVRTKVPNLWIVPSGKLPPNAVGLLTSKRLKECVNHFADKYDLVLYDSPPVLGLSDTAVLASLVDRVLLCVEYRKYPKSISVRSKKTLENIGGKILGAVINNINVLKEDPTYYSQVYHYFQTTNETDEEVGSGTASKKDGAASGQDIFDDKDGWS